MPSPGDPERHPACFIHGRRWHGDSTPKREEPTPPVRVLAAVGHPGPKPFYPSSPIMVPRGDQLPTAGSQTTLQAGSCVLHGFCGSGTWEQLSRLAGSGPAPLGLLSRCAAGSSQPQPLGEGSALAAPTAPTGSIQLRALGPPLCWLSPSSPLPQRRLEARAQSQEGSVSTSPHVASGMWN